MCLFSFPSGALGPVDGINPELSNLTCSLTFVNPGDIVFLTSDGVSDNFDPVVGKFCVPAKTVADNVAAQSKQAFLIQRQLRLVMKMPIYFRRSCQTLSSRECSPFADN
jgi:molybdopterin-guanine dinucleotide biosynthesis protein A